VSENDQDGEKDEEGEKVNLVNPTLLPEPHRCFEVRMAHMFV
jgi:hypothetical protein